MKRDAEDELRGRMVALETLLGVTIARLAEIAPDPDAMIVAIMANTEDMLARAQQEAGEEHAAAAQFARAAFDALGDALQQHLAQRSKGARRN
jgi:hypothetical protein